MAIRRNGRIGEVTDTSVIPPDGYCVRWNATAGQCEFRAPNEGGAGGPHALIGADHTASGLTAGHVVRATGAATFAFGAIQDGDLPAGLARDTEVSAAVTAHEGAADPHAGYQKESEKGAANGYASLGADGKVPAAQLPASGGGNGYVLNLMAANLATTTDGATIYFGCLAGLAPQTTAALARVYIPKAGTLKVAEVWARAATAGSAENWSAYVRLNNATDTLIQTLGAGTATRRWTNTALNVSVALGDYVEIKMVCPTWATNPATVALGGTLYIE